MSTDESLSSSAIQAMTDSDQSSQNIFDSDWNSNQYISDDVKHTEQKSLDDSFFEQYNNIKSNANRLNLRQTPTSPMTSPIYGLHQKDLSYDDLSKNIDANLAEIDMETFRSEDINSILALPAIYTGDFQSDSRGEQCASVSGSLLNELDLDTSASNRHSEDEISICKDEPLFSPLREPPAATTTISVDSLDNSSSYEQDLVLTCKANKNNYTIVFEGSSTQFSDDSDYQEICRSSEGEGSFTSGHQVQNSFKKHNSMYQSDLNFTTWSKVWKSQRVSHRRKSEPNSTKISSKSKSLPNLSHNSVFITDKQLVQWAKWCGNHRFPLYEVVHNYQAVGMHVANSKEPSVSLLKLFMKHKMSSNSSLGSSGNSESSTSLIMQPLNFRNSTLHNSLNMQEKIKPLQRNTEDTKNKVQNDNQTFMDNNQWSPEANNNNINYQETATENRNNNLDVTNEDCDNSQYFEDSLMDVPSPPLKHFHATPIKEEEETDISSGDEVMRDSKNPFGSDESTSGEITVIQSSTKIAANLDRLKSIFPTKSKTFSMEAKKSSEISTQTKQFNLNDAPEPNIYRPLQAFSCRTSSNQTDCDTITTCTPSRDSSPASSGYISSRHSSVERSRPLSQIKTADQVSGISTTAAQSGNVVLTTSCSCGTQIPVHVKDSAAQTCTFGSVDLSSSGFTLKESTTALPEPGTFPKVSTIKTPFQSISSQTRHHHQNDRKSIYVCYPNYSLPDLSFLQSVMDESESVYMNPTGYKLPEEIVHQRRPSRPSSYGNYESVLQKHLMKIKDLDSLNVLLPDDLKLLISKAKGMQHDSSMSSSFSNADDATKLKAFDSSYNQHTPRSILRKSSSAEHCKDGRCRANLPVRCTSASAAPNRSLEDDLANRRSSRELSPRQCSHSSSSPMRMYPYENSDRKSSQEFSGKCSFGSDSSDSKDSQSSHSKKAVKFCERSPTKNSKQSESSKSSRGVYSCDSHGNYTDQVHGFNCSCDMCSLELEKAPPEFLLSPTKNPLLYSEITDSYAMQNYSGGKFFQETLRRKTGLVENLRKASQVIYEYHKTTHKKGVDSSHAMGQKILSWLCPAVHTILSDGVLPSVQGFFGPLPNSPWKVAGASIKQGEARKDVENLLKHINSEKLLTDSTYRFNAFILGLLNLGCFEWWLGHLCSQQSLICHHYHPTALLSLLALPAAVHLRHELKELVNPLTNIKFGLDITLETKVAWKKYDEGNYRPDAGQKGATDLAHRKNHSPTHRRSVDGEIWPGVTTNPFPNAKFVDDSGHRKMGHPNHDDSPTVDTKEGQQFKILRQKWEKFAAKPTAAPKSKHAASSSSKTKKKVDPSPPRQEVPKTPTKTPPLRRARNEPPMEAERRRSHIPTLQFGKAMKSMIPVQKVGGTRARSANGRYSME